VSLSFALLSPLPFPRCAAVGEAFASFPSPSCHDPSRKANGFAPFFPLFPSDHCDRSDIDPSFSLLFSSSPNRTPSAPSVGASLPFFSEVPTKNGSAREALLPPFFFPPPLLVTQFLNESIFLPPFFFFASTIRYWCTQGLSFFPFPLPLDLKY